MSEHSRKTFRPSLEGSRLEARLVLSGTAHHIVSVTAAHPNKNKQPAPLLTPQNVKVKFTTDALAAVGAAYGAFQNAELQAVRNASVALANGGNNAALTAGLQTTTGLQGGILESKLLSIASRFTGGADNLYGPAPAVVSSKLSRGKPPVELNPSAFLPMNSQRLMVQAQTLINSILASETSVQNAASVMDPTMTTFTSTTTTTSTTTAPPVTTTSTSMTTPPVTSTTTTNTNSSSTTNSTTNTSSNSATLSPNPTPPSITMTSVMATASLKSYLKHMVKAGYLFTS